MSLVVHCAHLPCACTSPHELTWSLLSACVHIAYALHLLMLLRAAHPAATLFAI